MKEIFTIISIILYFLIGVICFIMAYESFFSKKFLPFLEEASGMSWESVDKPLQFVIITILRISGLGFFVVALLLTVFPIVNYFISDNFVKYAIPVISFMYCFGIFLFNYNLYKKTKANTPWRGSLIVMFIILVGITISSI
jgi:phosphoglycerol transferase MdoB-like AlkP superfamily enzyme